MPSILNDERYQDLWRELEPQLQSIMDRTPIRCAQYMDLYTKIFKFYSTSNLIAPKPSNSQNVPFYHQRIFTADICRKLASLFTVNLERVYIKLKDLIGGDGMNLLRAYADEWEQFEPSLRMIDGIFSYVNRYWSTRLTSRYLGETLKDALEVTSVYGEGILYWQSVVVERLAPRLTEYCLAIISEKRTVNSDCPEKEELLLKVTDTYVCLGYNVREKYIKDQSTNRKKHIGFFSKTKLPSSVSLTPVVDLVLNIKDSEGTLYYKQYFHEAFIQTTMEFFAAESSSLIAKNDMGIERYLSAYFERLSQETDRVNTLLHHSSLESLQKTIEKTYILDQIEFIFTEAQRLLEHHTSESSQVHLRQIFELCLKHDDILRRLRDMFERHVYESGMEAINVLIKKIEGSGSKSLQQLEPADYVETILALHRSFSHLNRTSFPNSNMFNTAMDKAFAKFVNSNIITESTSNDSGGHTSKSPELLARYCDLVIRKKTKSFESDDVDECLKNAMIVFNYIEDKDVFEKFYGKLLARRLVALGSIDQNIETDMIDRLKTCCGFEYTQKLHRMFSDVSSSRTLNDELHEELRTKFGFEFSATIATTGAWPFSGQTPEFNKLQVFANACNLFDERYQSHHSGRKLTWLPQLGRVEMRATFGTTSPRQYLLQLSEYQATVLAVFNDISADPISLTNLVEKTGLQVSIVEQIMAIFVKSKIVVMTTDQRYRVNDDFVSKRYKINLNYPLKTELRQDSEHTEKRVSEDRALMIMASIVRVMKGRKVAKADSLIEDVISVLKSRFRPKVADIKRSIESCIEKEYIAKDEDGNESTTSYKYLA